MVLVIALALIALACGEGGKEEPGATATPVQQEDVTDGQEPAEEEPVEDADAEATVEAGEEAGEATAAPTVGPGFGTVTIGDTTYEFTVDYCQLDVEGGEIEVTGQGLGPDGRTLTVRATRSGQIDTVQVRLSEGLTVFVAATGTSDALGGEAPSLQVDGRRVTTTATFYTTEEQEQGAEATGAQGSFVAQCP
jgi:hypothetical protein